MDSSSGIDGTMWPGYLVGAAAVVTTLAAVHVATNSALVREAAWALLVASALAMVLAGVHRHRPDHDRPWRILALAMGLLVVDNLVLFPVWGPSPARDLISDVAQLLAFPCLGLVALGLVHRQVPNGDREGAIDACTVMVALFSALYGLVFAPQTAESPTVLGTAVWLVAPLLLAAVTAAGLRLVFVGGHHVASMWFIVASSVSALIGHVLRTLAQSAGTYERGEWQDLFVAAAYVAAGLAALHPSMTVLTQPAAPGSSSERRLTLGRLSILGISLVTPPVTMLLQGDEGPRFVPLVASIAATVLVMWRLWRLIKERERVREEMSIAAIQDALTGLPNRAAMLAGLAAALARGSRAGTETALLFIDLDDFKTVNDTWGHGAGDRVLTIAAARLRDSGRTGDLLARLAGDEFVIVCEDTPPETAVAIARRTIHALQAPLQVEGVAYPLTASVGVATSRSASGQSDLLMSAADHAMYQAKRQGGSAVGVHGFRDSKGTSSRVVRTG
jgi:diguanylate cyclase (GGDEF)-like protein